VDLVDLHTASSVLRMQIFTSEGRYMDDVLLNKVAIIERCLGRIG